MAEQSSLSHYFSGNTDKQRLFTVYIWYRLGVSILLGVLFMTGLGENFLGTYHSNIFTYNSTLYIGLGCLTLWLCHISIININARNIIVILIVDFLYLAILIHTSSNAIDGLSYLLLIPIAFGSTFLRGKTSVALAALASLLLLVSSVLGHFETPPHQQSFFTTGITGVALFTAAISFRLLSKRIQSDEYRIRQHIEQNDFLENISQRIIETIDTGIMVINHDLHTLFINDTAKKMLAKNGKLQTIEQIKPLVAILKKWQQSKNLPREATVNIGMNQNIKIGFSTLSEKNNQTLMLRIEDVRLLTQAAQQLKLASLGRLTSSIAHEIRNPLGAISHAGQLLDEADYLKKEEKELLNIVQENSQRIDQTINNILDFSKRKQANMETIELNQWLASLISGYMPSLSKKIRVTSHANNIYALFDPHHLQQIMTNLIDNAFRHGMKGDESIITVELAFDKITHYPYINVIDEGDGIQEENIDVIFEPFYTTKSTGSGLGLYLCKELCQANQANIAYLQKTTQSRSCFRLILSKPQHS